MLDQPEHRSIRLALENSIIRITRRPEDLLTLLAAVDHPRFGINFDADNFYNAGIEPFPYAYELLREHIFQVHVKDSGRYIPAVHGDTEYAPALHAARTSIASRRPSRAKPARTVYA